MPPETATAAGPTPPAAPPKESAADVFARALLKFETTQADLRARALRLVNAPRPSPGDAKIVGIAMSELLGALYPVIGKGDSAQKTIRRAATLDEAPSKIRGHQVEIGGTIFQVPQHDPFSDEDVVATEGLIDDVRFAAEPADAESSFAAKLAGMLQDDIGRCMRQRRRAAKDGPGLFDPKPPAGVGTAAAQDFVAKVEGSLTTAESINVETPKGSVTIKGKRTARHPRKGGAS